MIWHIRIEDSTGKELDASRVDRRDPPGVHALASLMLEKFPDIERQAVWFKWTGAKWLHVGTIAIYPTGNQASLIQSPSTPPEGRKANDERIIA